MVTFIGLCMLAGACIAFYFCALFVIDVASSTYRLACHIKARLGTSTARVKVGLAAMREYQPARY